MRAITTQRAAGCRNATQRRRCKRSLIDEAEAPVKSNDSGVGYFFVVDYASSLQHCRFLPSLVVQVGQTLRCLSVCADITASELKLKALTEAFGRLVHRDPI